MGVCMYGCMGEWVCGCTGVWVYGWMENVRVCDIHKMSNTMCIKNGLQHEKSN